MEDGESAASNCDATSRALTELELLLRTGRPLPINQCLPIGSCTIWRSLMSEKNIRLLDGISEEQLEAERGERQACRSIGIEDAPSSIRKGCSCTKERQSPFGGLVARRDTPERLEGLAELMHSVGEHRPLRVEWTSTLWPPPNMAFYPVEMGGRRYGACYPKFPGQ